MEYGTSLNVHVNEDGNFIDDEGTVVGFAAGAVVGNLAHRNDFAKGALLGGGFGHQNGFQKGAALGAIGGAGFGYHSGRQDARQMDMLINQKIDNHEDRMRDGVIMAEVAGVGLQVERMGNHIDRQLCKIEGNQHLLMKEIHCESDKTRDFVKNQIERQERKELEKELACFKANEVAEATARKTAKLIALENHSGDCDWNKK